MFKRLLFLLLISAAPAFAQGTAYENILITTSTLNNPNHYLSPVTNATITVCAGVHTEIPCTPAVTIYSDIALTVPITPPLTTSPLGNYRFVVAAGTYSVSFTGPGISVSNDVITLGGGGSGTVTTSGSPANGNLAQFSGPTMITNGNLSGDCTTSGALTITCTKTNGSAFVASATTDTTNASNITSGTLPVGRIPAAIPIGDVGSAGLSGTAPIAIASTGVISGGGLGTVTGALRGNGSGTITQAACADLSNAAASCSTDTTNASNISSGTLPCGREPALTGDATTSAGSCATTVVQVNGAAVPASKAVVGTNASSQFIDGTPTTNSLAGPIINCVTYGCNSTLADNATAFTNTVTAFNNASLTAGNPTVKSSIGPAGTPAATCSSCTSLNPSFTIAAGDTVIVAFIGVPNNGRTVTITDSGSNKYRQINAIQTNGTSVQIWGTFDGGAGASATSITASISGAAAQLNLIVISFTNVGTIRFYKVLPANSGSSTAPSVALASTLDTNNIFLTFFGWFQAATTVTASANSGTLQQNFPSSSTVAGGAAVTTVNASVAAATDSITLNTSASWVGESIELRSRTAARPIMYIPPGVYNYSSGLNFTQPGTLMCTPGTATLNYIGTAHAVDMGATLTTNTKNSYPIGEDGCDFTGGNNMTDGIVFNDWNVLVYVKNSSFRNFTNSSSTSRMIAGFCDNWDMEIGPQNRFVLTNLVPGIIFQNDTGCSSNRNSFVRFHDNLAACWQGDNVDGTQLGCTGAQSGVGIIMDGAQQRVWHNNIAFWSPDVRFTCAADLCYGNQVDNNILESATGAGTDNTIQFGGNQNGLLITQNAVTTQNSTGGFIGPVGGSDTLAGARINFNTINLQANTTVLVKQNNVTAQGQNTSYGNTCSVTEADNTFNPCPLIHTTGANISPWVNTIDGDNIASLNNCAAVGSAANPSVAACAGATAGQFSCATNASTGTCQVNTTAVTANSEIIVQESDTTVTGTRLGVTCNTSTNVLPASRLLASSVAATSFTINLGTVTTNPACFSYHIIN